MRLFAFIILVPFLIGCATTPPRNKNNACMILMEKDEWVEPLVKASRTWGIPKHTILSIIYHESKFISDAKPPKRRFLGMRFFGRRISSAYGYSQALEGTWEDYKRNTGNSFASRTNFADSVDFIGWYLNRAVRILGISPVNAYELYLSYHQGIAGFKKKSYLRKPRIQNYARGVQKTALIYKAQIKSCS